MNNDLAAWNDRMYELHPTPYTGLAGIVERARLKKIKDLASIQPDDAVLELGCEAGNLLLSLPATRKVVGFDISARALEQARASFAESGRSAKFVQGDAALPLPFSPGDFSVIICSEMLEHVHDPRAVLLQIHTIATPDTRIILTVPYEKPKLVIKNVLLKLGVFKWLMPGIEIGQSEWHLQQFSKKKLLQEIEGLFRPLSAKTVLGLHVIAEVRKLV